MNVKELVSEMTLQEKASLLSGADFWHTKAVERLGIREFMMCDGPNGVRKQEGESDHLGLHSSISTVCYPTASSVASAFDKDLAKELGERLGDECVREDIAMLLGPGLNMKRSPVCGRNFEYFSSCFEESLSCPDSSFGSSSRVIFNGLYAFLDGIQR